MSDTVESILVAIDAGDLGDYTKSKEILTGLPQVVIRTRDAGVHFGHLSFIANAQHGCYRVVLSDGRRIWNWTGANTLSEIALHGISGGKVSEPTQILLPQVIEVIPCTPESEAVLNKQKW